LSFVEEKAEPTMRFSAAAARRMAPVASSSLLAATTAGSPPLLAQPRRWKNMLDPNVDAQLPEQVKSTATRAVEAQERGKLYSMQEYMEQEQSGERKTVGETLSAATDDPKWTLYGLAFVAFTAMYAVAMVRLRREKMRFDPKMRAVRAIDVPSGPSIGGPFELLDVETGLKFTNEDLLGKWIYVYFGFTNCPDICPDEMAKMTRLIKHLDKKIGADAWQPLFVSVDAKRDDAATVRKYLKDFHPRIKGLTGTAEQVEAAAREYRVFFAVPDEFEQNAPDYLIDHSIIMYLMNPEGEFVDYTTKEFTWHESYTKLLRRIIDYERDKKDTTKVNERIANAASFSDKDDIKNTKKA
jgi:protein SCO1/2